MSLLITGSIALDSVKTPIEEHHDLLGGSASYASIAASFFSPVNMVGVVGSDFPKKYLDLYRQRGVNLDGLQVVEGKTFRWSGEYEWDLNRRRTLSVALNVFETFNPTLPAHYAATPFVFLANISPQLQMHVLGQVKAPKFVVADTMDLWIETAPSATLTFADCSPNFSCQATISYSPAGRPLIVNLPSSPVVAKNGWLNTPTYAAIHGWTSHLNFTMTSGFAKVRVVSIP